MSNVYRVFSLVETEVVANNEAEAKSFALSRLNRFPDVMRAAVTEAVEKGPYKESQNDDPAYGWGV